MSELMLQPESSELLLDLEAQDTYTDPVFLEEAGALRLAERLWDAGMLGGTDSCVETVSLFTVIKGYSAEAERQLRPVWDERRANLRWQTPPWVPLGSPASWAFLDLAKLPQHKALISAVGDVPSFFSRLEIPRAFWPYFVLAGVEVEAFRAYMAARGRPLASLEGQFLALKVLVMGWSWAPFLAH
eukprot:7059604-Alexandrium_andersonii.AAC.1